MFLENKIDGMSQTMRARLPLLSRIAFDFAFKVAKWQMRSVTRKSLRKLDGHMLCDIGLEPHTAQGESTKRFWQD